MARVVQEIVPGQGGLNWDDDYRFMAKDDKDYVLNMIPNAFGTEFVLTNMLGNTLHEHTFTHASEYATATYTCIGDCYDDNRDAVYFFIYSDGGNDCILRFLFSDYSFEKIVWDHTGIDLDINYPITDAFMIGDWLHFNPRSTSPRAINVQWAYWDHVAYTKPSVAAGNWSVGDYVKENNKVYLVNTAFAKVDLILIDHPEDATFVEWTYQDVDTVQGSGTYGEYDIVRDFYNTPILASTEPPYVAYGSDANVDANYIRGNIFQFCYRFYVPEQGYTIASSFSDMAVNANDETWDGEKVGDVTENNYIEAGFNVGDGSSVPYVNSGRWLFEFVEILFRENSSESWKVADRIYHDDACTYATNLAVTGVGSTAYICRTQFYNDRSYEAVDSVSIEKSHNPLPLLANSQWSLDGERSSYGGITEGRDPIQGPLKVELSAGSRRADLLGDIQTVLDTYDFTESQLPVAGIGSFYTYTSESISADPGGSSPLYIEFNFDGQSFHGSHTYSGAFNAAAFRDDILLVVNQAPGVTAIENGTTIFFVDTKPHAANIIIYDTGPTELTANKFQTFKSNSEHPFCIFYFDDMLRRADPQTQVEYSTYGTTVFIPSFPDNPALTRGTNYQNYIDWSISHDAPSWASYWCWGYAGNQNLDRNRDWVYNIEAIEEKTSGDYDGFIEIDISGLQQLSDSSATHDTFLPNTNILAYSFLPGDRIKFITSPVEIYGTSTTTSTTSTTTIEPVEDYADIWLADPGHDFEIKAFDDVNHKIYIDGDALDASELAGYADTPNQVLVEIYTPLKQAGKTVYYEFGQLYRVYESGGRYFHRGQTQDQTAGQAALGQFNNGDAYLIPRIFANSPFVSANSPLFVESFHWSDFYDSNTWGKGKPGFISGIGQKYLNNVRYSNRYDPNTLSSGLSTFDFLDYKPLSTDHGNITAMRQAGNTLKVYFERNSASVLVNKTQLYDADGQSQVVKSDKVLGDVVYSNYHYGTIFPESVLLKDRTVYFFDIYRDAMIRDSSNGIEPISDYKMRRYFKEKADALLSSGVSNVQVWTAYDFDYDLLLVHFIDSVNSANDEVIMFHEPSNRWVSFLQVTDDILEVSTTTTTSSTSTLTTLTTPTTTTTSTTSTHSYDSGLIFGKGSMTLVSYIGDAVYTHNDNTTRNNFWGDQRESIVHVIANEAPNIKKTFENIAIHSNKPWNINYVGVAVDSTYASGMQSKVPESRFKLREGIFGSDYLRNMKTNSSSASNLDLVRGEQLRGYYATHRLINDDTSEVTLFKVDVYGNVSRI